MTLYILYIIYIIQYPGVYTWYYDLIHMYIYVVHEVVRLITIMYIFVQFKIKIKILIFGFFIKIIMYMYCIHEAH